MTKVVEELINQGNKLFSDRPSLLRMWQDLAENFYPERADFTSDRVPGAEAKLELAASHPVLARRDLGNALSNTRPTTKNWFHTRTKYDWDKVSPVGRAWLERSEEVQRRAMLHRTSQFLRATTEIDHDWATFGQGIIQPSFNRSTQGLLYRSWHLRDVVWTMNVDGVIDTVYRQWKPRAADLVKLFPGTVHKEVAAKVAKDPYCEVPTWHVVVPAEMYTEVKTKHAFVSLFIDIARKHVMEATGVIELGYIIPRWATISGSQYAFSPATAIALMDARGLQSMMYTLLEAGEKAVNPPMVANKHVFGGQAPRAYAGGTTWADYTDGALKDHFQMVEMDKSGIPLGMDMMRDLREQISEAMYSKRILLPPMVSHVSAYEMGERAKQHIREILPLFSPYEDEVNAPLCDDAFERLLRVGAFGSPLDMPEELRGAEIEFSFESPLHDAVDQAKVQVFMDMNQQMTTAMAVDPTVKHVVNMGIAYRDVIQANQTPAKWMRTEAEAKALAESEKAAADASQALALQQQGADVAQTIGDTNIQGA